MSAPMFCKFHFVWFPKISLDKDIYPFLKTMGSYFSSQPHTSDIQNQNIQRNMKLQISEVNNNEKKKLAVFLPWISAKDKYLEKFRSLYLTRGFDVLTLPFSPKDLLFPTSGSQVIATNLLDYLKTHQNYSQVVMHAFSVGAYLMGEIFIKMLNKANNYTSVAERIAGVVLDSAVDIENTHVGVPRAISSNPIVIKCLEWYVLTHMYLMYNVSTKYYIQSSEQFHDTPLRCPALFYVSEIDMIGTKSGNKKVVDKWQSKGVDVKMMVFKDSSHVGHFRKYPDEYVSELDTFLAKLDLLSCSKL